MKVFWCGHCQENFEEDHYNKRDEHKIGEQYGSFGADRAFIRDLRADNEALREALVLALDTVNWDEHDRIRRRYQRLLDGNPNNAGPATEGPGDYRKAERRKP